MGKVYMRLILSTLQPEENYINGMIRGYNDERETVSQVNMNGNSGICRYYL